VPPPADPEQPRAGMRNRRIATLALDGRAPPVEPLRGRERIRSTELAPAPVLARVVEHVDKGPPHLERCPQHVLVRSIAEHGSAPAPQTVQRARDANAETAKAADERAPVIALGDQVHVVRLHREVHQAEARLLAPARERAPQRAERRSVSEPRQAPPYAQGHMHRMPAASGALRACDSASGFVFGRPAPSRGPPRPPKQSSSCRMRLRAVLLVFDVMPSRPERVAGGVTPFFELANFRLASQLSRRRA
jgi:hypothetical protein